MHTLRKHQKTLAILLGVMILLVGGVINSFTGNPLSAMVSERVIKAYVAEKYPDLNLSVGKVTYNFKFDEYMAIASSEDSIDTHFAVYCRNGKVTHDDYDSYVVGKFNTLSRFEEEYSNRVIPILAADSALKNNTSMVVLEDWEAEKDKFELDAPSDPALLGSTRLIIRLDLEKPTTQEIARIFEDALPRLKEKGYHFEAYDLFSEVDGMLVMVSDVRPEDILSGSLERILDEARKPGARGWIQVDIHETVQ